MDPWPLAILRGLARAALIPLAAAGAAGWLVRRHWPQHPRECRLACVEDSESPHGKIVVVPALATYSHSASVSSRYPSPPEILTVALAIVWPSRWILVSS
jgi:hypothetical protein